MRPPVVSRGGLIGLAVVLFASCVSCGVPYESSPDAISSDQVPEVLRPSDSSVPSGVAQREPIDVWFVEADHLVSVRHRVDPPVTAQVVLDDLLSGPSDAEQNRSLRTAIPDAAVVVGVSVAGGAATVSLAPAFAQIPAADQVLAVGQIVLTLTDQRGIGRVRFAVDETTIAVPLPAGDTATDSVSRDDYVVLAAGS